MIGYARVSTFGQTVAAQVEHLTAAGCTTVFRETASGASADRPQLRKAVNALPQGGILVVTRLDRLARSTHDLLNIIAEVKAKGASFKSLADTWADTTTPHGELILTVLAGLAQFERSLIKERTTEGRDRAKARGVRMGRKPKLTAHQRLEALNRRAAGENVTDIARSYNVSHSTISRLASAQRFLPQQAGY